MSSTWVNAALSGASLIAGLIFAAGTGRRHCGRSARLVHALMGIGMAGMFSPWGDPVPVAAGGAVFVVVALWSAVQGLRADRLGTTESVHLVIGPAAMALMYLAGGPGHRHGSAAATVSPLLSVAALALIGYFVWYAWFLAGRLPRPAVATAAGGVAVAQRVTTVRWVAGAHVAMCVMMALMFLSWV